MTNLQKRILAAAIYLPLTLLSAWDTTAFSLMMSLVLGFAWHEYLCFREKPRKQDEWIQHSLKIAVGILPLVLTAMGFSLELGMAAIALWFLGLLIMSMTRRGTLSAVKDELSFETLGFLYLSLLFSLLVGVQIKSGAPAAIWFIFLVVGASDTAAYFVGKSMGKTPFFQNISPSKTQEGFMAGVTAGALAGALLCGVLKYFEFKVPELGVALVLGGVVAVIGAFGDLFESLIKRSYGVKDSGGIIPGHGGVLDRFDAVMFAAVPVFFFVVLRGGFR